MRFLHPEKYCVFIVLLSFAIMLSVKNPSGGQGWRQLNEKPLDLRLQLQENVAGLRSNFYQLSCPDAENIIFRNVKKIVRNHSDAAPALLRLAFHDCFVEGCDASVLLDHTEGLPHMPSEKTAVPNKDSLKGYGHIDKIKSILEDQCPKVVSCADIIVLSARDAVRLTGGPFYQLDTGRRDGTISIASFADAAIPSPHDSLNFNMLKFKRKGFTDAEIVSLSGAHSIGRAHCRFFESRLKNFSGTGKPDPSMDIEYADKLRSRCDEARNSSKLSHFFIPMDFNSDHIFDNHYYVNLVAGRGLLFSDQSLMMDNRTRPIVQQFAANVEDFYHEFSSAMIKLSNLGVLTGTQGHIRTHCSKVKRGPIQQEIIP